MAGDIYKTAMNLECKLFKSIKVPRIDKLTPDSGPSGTPIEINGTWPQAVKAVVFGDKIVQVQQPPVTQKITVKAPIGSQKVDVFVIDVADNNSNTLKYTYK